MKKYFLCLILVFSFCAKAQKASDDFKKINEVYKNKKTFSVHVQYKVYKSHTDESAIEKEDGVVKMKDGMFYNKMAGVEIIKNKDYFLMIDNQEKIIQIGPRNKDVAMSKDQALLFTNMELVLQTCSEVRFESINDRLNKYTLQCPSAEYEKMEVIYDKKTFFIDKVTIFYKNKINFSGENTEKAEKPRVEIQYAGMEFQAGVKDDFFTYGNYLKNENGKLIVSEKYKGYRLIDQLTKKEVADKSKTKK